MSGYDIQAEADRIASEALPEFDPKAMRRLMQASFDQALIDLFITRKDVTS